MNKKIRYYTDSKELPLRVYERIETTGDFFYMIKGYDAGDKIDANVEECELKFNELVQEYVLSVNKKNFDLIEYGSLLSKNNEVNKYILLLQIIEQIERANEIRIQNGLETCLHKIKEVLKGIKIPKKDDINEQKKILYERINKIQNDIEDIKKRLNIDENKESDPEVGINEKVVSVSVILERDIDMDKTSLYQFALLEQMAYKKIENLNKK